MKELNFGNGSIQQISLKSTLISLVPFPISEFKPGLTPGQFDMEASVGGVPSIKVIGESHYHVYIDHERGNLRVVDPSYKVAQSVVMDYLQAQLAAKPECHPAFFWKLGEFSASEVMAKFPDEVQAYNTIQMDWFLELIKLADDDWEKSRQHNSISDIQRFALKAIDPTNSKMRPWVLVNPLHEAAKEVKTQLCRACGSDVPFDVAICRYCRHIIDPVRYKQMQFAEVSGDPLAGLDLGKITRQ